MSRGLFIAGTVPFMIAGLGHAVLALLDTFRPKFFKPLEGAVIPAMEESGIALRAMFPGSRVSKPSMWQGWLGFNISHGLGAFVFGLLLLVIAVYDFELVTDIKVIQPLSVVAAALYFGLSLRYWFYGPAMATGFGFGCFLLAALTG